jgi:hypothetical protein
MVIMNRQSVWRERDLLPSIQLQNHILAIFLDIKYKKSSVLIGKIDLFPKFWMVLGQIKPVFVFLDAGVKVGDDFGIAEFSVSVAPVAVLVQPEDSLFLGNYADRKGGVVHNYSNLYRKSLCVHVEDEKPGKSRRPGTC